MITRCPGWKVFVFTGNARLARHIGHKPMSQVHLFNGKIPCRLLEYEMRNGEADGSDTD
jgi:putative N6-adenine-specific DNA methylase